MNFCEIDEGFLHHRRHILEKENWFSLEKIYFNVWITMDNQNKISASEKKKKAKTEISLFVISILSSISNLIILLSMSNLK